MFSIIKFPSMVFWGIGVKSLDKLSCTTRVNYHYRNKNPFKSLYFATSVGAAELATGLLVQRAIMGEGKWSMVVQENQSKFTKRGLGKLTYICNDGAIIAEKITELKSFKKGIIKLSSTGYDESGDEIGQFDFIWRLKYYG
jgi:hypothetical protein